MTRSRRSAARAIVVLAAVCATQATPLAAQPALTADSVVRRALALVGGEPALRGVQRVSMSMMTQWQRTGFRSVPFTDQPSFEQHTDVRDYSIPAWRNTRDFGRLKIINVVRDSIALTNMGQEFRPLSVAYVDERTELFLYTPDRLLLALRDAPAIRRGADTVFGGEPHLRVTGTLAGRFPSTVFFHAGTGLPTMLRFRAGHPNDFGLVAWGVMPVEIWYSAWRTHGAISIASQWDILRVGVPYKRMTVLRADFNPTFAADSFTVTPEQRTMYLTSPSVKPMHETVVRREVRMVTPTLANVTAFGLQSGAVRSGAGWLMLGAAVTPFSYAYGERLLDSLGAAPITAVLAATAISATNGGILTALDRGLPVYMSAATEPALRRILANGGRPMRGLRRVTPGLTIGEGEHRLRLEPVDLPNTPGSMMLYQEQSGWLYIPDAVTPLDIAVAREKARALGWSIKAIGTAPALYQPTGSGN